MAPLCSSPASPGRAKPLLLKRTTGHEARHDNRRDTGRVGDGKPDFRSRALVELDDRVAELDRAPLLRVGTEDRIRDLASERREQPALQLADEQIRVAGAASGRLCSSGATGKAAA